MKKGFTLLEMLVVVLIIGILSAIALPYYQNAVESSRTTEVVLLWGRQKNWATGHNLSAEQAQKATERLQQAGLKYFTGEVICREKEDPNECCWEAEFTRHEDSSVRYKLITTHNFAHLACMGLNNAGKKFCESQSQQETPDIIGGEETFLFR
jgi:prepilin-type N-terminal cleavage/methylation domain-containing protein